jgi:predicted nucleotidyltransferase
MLIGSTDVSERRIREFSERWRIVELALFGSVVADDFGPDSDIDVLVVFEPNAGWNLFHLLDMKDELQAMLGRKVDLVEKAALRNPFRRHEILRTRKVIYAA